MSDENDDNGEPSFDDALSAAAEEERREIESSLMKRNEPDIGWPSDEELIKTYSKNRTTFYAVGASSIIIWVAIVSAILIHHSIAGAPNQFHIITALIGSVTSIIVGGLYMLGRALPLRASR